MVAITTGSPDPLNFLDLPGDLQEKIVQRVTHPSGPRGIDRQFADLRRVSKAWLQTADEAGARRRREQLRGLTRDDKDTAANMSLPEIDEALRLSHHVGTPRATLIHARGLDAGGPLLESEAHRDAVELRTLPLHEAQLQAMSVTCRLEMLSTAEPPRGEVNAFRLDHADPATDVSPKVSGAAQFAVRSRVLLSLSERSACSEQEFFSRLLDPATGRELARGETIPKGVNVRVLQGGDENFLVLKCNHRLIAWGKNIPWTDLQGLTILPQGVTILTMRVDAPSQRLVGIGYVARTGRANREPIAGVMGRIPIWRADLGGGGRLSETKWSQLLAEGPSAQHMYDVLSADSTCLTISRGAIVSFVREFSPFEHVYGRHLVVAHDLSNGRLLYQLEHCSENGRGLGVKLHDSLLLVAYVSTEGRSRLCLSNLFGESGPQQLWDIDPLSLNTPFIWTYSAAAFGSFYIGQGRDHILRIHAGEARCEPAAEVKH